MTVVAWGVVGGLGGTLFVSGFNVPIPELWKDLLGNGTKRQLGFHTFRNGLSGALAAWASWTLYTPVADPAIGRAANESVILGAILSGGVGASLVSSLLAGKAKDQAIAAKDQQIVTKDAAIDNLGETVNELTPSEANKPTPPQGPPAP